MRRALLLAVFGSMLLVGSAGVALAADVFCTGGPCEGTELDDFITGTAQSDQIFALGGFDVVFALAGQDELNGQNGSDALFGENNSDTYFGGGGSDLLSEFESLTEVTNSGADVMNGGSSDDLLEGNTGADILRGQAGDECSGPINDAFSLVTRATTICSAVPVKTAWKATRGPTSTSAARTTTSSMLPTKTKWVRKTWWTAGAAST